MSLRRLLLLSNSTNYGQEFLEHAVRDIRNFLIEGHEIKLLGEKSARVFKSGEEAKEYGPVSLA